MTGMTREDEDKLREMQSELMRMSDQYRPVGGYDTSEPAASVNSLAWGITLVLYGYSIVVDKAVRS